MGRPNIDRMKAEMDVAGLIVALNDKNWVVRYEAAYALGWIGGVRVVGPLARALGDTKGEVRKAAARSLGKIRNTKAVEPLVQALNDKDKNVRKAAASALGEIGGAGAIEVLVQALNHKDKDVRREAADALKEARARDPQEAVDILFGDAMGAVPELTDKQLQSAYERMRRSWRSASLVEGTESKVKSHILKQSQKLAKRSGFEKFSIELCLADKGYKGEEAAQIWAHIGNESIACHLWKTKDKYHAFGLAIFREVY